MLNIEIDWQTAAAFGIVFFGAFVQTSIGFGMAIVAAPVLFLLDNAYVPAPMTMASLITCLFTTWHFRRHLSLKGLGSALIWRIPGSIAGVGLLMVISESALAVLIALVIGSGLLATYLRVSIPFNNRNLGIAGFLSGVMGTSTAIGGPPMAIVMQGQLANVIRGNLAAFFIFSCITSLLVLLPTEYLGLQELRLALPLIPAAFFGSLLASKLSHLVSDSAMRNGCLVLCSLSVAMMLLQYLR